MTGIAGDRQARNSPGFVTRQDLFPTPDPGLCLTRIFGVASRIFEGLRKSAARLQAMPPDRVAAAASHSRRRR
jgi:hypothetical protein